MRDERVDLPVTRTEVPFEGRIWDVVREDVDLGEAGTVTREFMRHPGAVAVVALDEEGRMLMIRQYRHPVRHYLWEIPAGLLDIAGEPLVEAAKRELAEEADLRAGRWDTLADFFTSPGGSDEPIRVFLARDLTEIPEAERDFVREGEEVGMRREWITPADAADAVLDGSLHNPSAVVGIFAAERAARRGFSELRAPDAPWLR